MVTLTIITYNYLKQKPLLISQTNTNQSLFNKSTIKIEHKTNM